MRYGIFKQNVEMINNHNAQNHSYEMAMNHFGDLTFEEFSATAKGYLPRANMTRHYVTLAHNVRAGPALDWRTKNAVNPVQNQGQCGSCYSFSAVASVEGAWAIKKGQLLKLSEQQIVDCSRSFGNEGCNGGLEQSVFKYIISNKGLVASSQYPYTGRDTQACKKLTPTVTISSYVDVPQGNEVQMMAAAQKGPVSIAIDASHSFQFYSRGVFDDSRCGTSLDHAVNVVGFGTDAPTNKDYWIVRNSWGPGWGENGYARFVRGKNQCGMVLDASYPVV